MVREAIESLGCGSRKEILDYVKRKYGDVNENTILTHITVCAVNHPSRIYYSPNRRPRDCSTLAYHYDFLFKRDDGRYELYDPNKHGRWLIGEVDGKIRVIGPEGPLEPRKKRKSLQRKMDVSAMAKWETPLTEQELGEFYLKVSNFEKELRDFIKDMLGHKYIKRLKNELPGLVEGWMKRRKLDEEWGIEPEKELINYATIGEYILIIRKYSKLFVDNQQELAYVETKLRDFANFGRNPLMHCRTINRQNIILCEAAMKFLKGWMSRKARSKMK